MTDESIARSRPKRQSTSRSYVQQQFHSSDYESEGEELSAKDSNEEFNEESDVEDYKNEGTTGKHSGRKNVENGEISFENTAFPGERVGPNWKRAKIKRKSYKVKTTVEKNPNGRRFQDSYTGDGSENIYGHILDANLVRQTRKKDDDLTIAKSSTIVKLVGECIKRKGKGVRILNDQQSKPYLQSKRLDASESFLHPSAETLASADREAQLVSNVDFKEGIPLIGDDLKLKVGGSKSTMQEISLKKFESLKLTDATQIKDQQGVLINAGSHVYSTDWSYKSKAQMETDEHEYLCVSAAVDEWPRTLLVERIKRNSQPAVLQIWAISRKTWEATLEMKICLNGGRMSSVRWVPILENFGELDSCIGLLSVGRQDGLVELYAVPHSKALPKHEKQKIPMISLKPLVTFETKTGSPLCMEWLDPERVAVGYTDGHLAVWNLRETLENVLREGSEIPSARADMYVRLSRSSITDLAKGKQGEEEIFSVAYDGSVYYTHLSYSDQSTTLVRSRDTLHTVAFETFTNYVLCERLEDCTLRTIEYPQDGRASSRMVYPHYGRIRSANTSPHHPFVVSAGADGTVRCANVSNLMCGNQRRWAGGGMNTMFRLDFPDRSSNGPLEFIEPLASFPNARRPPRETLMKNQDAKSISVLTRQGLTLAWHPAINITTVEWNLNEGCETWIASGMAAGMVRIDVVGKAMKDQIGVEGDGDEEMQMSA